MFSLISFYDIIPAKDGRCLYMDQQEKKIIAPVVIGIGLLVYFCGIILVALLLPIPWWIKLPGGVLFLIPAGMILFVMIERVKEIRSGEEDDLNNY